MENANDIIANRLRRTRKAKKLTQEELAKACDISRQTIYEYEKGLYVPKLDNAGKLANVLGVSLDYLCYGKEQEPIYLEKPYLMTYKDLMRSFLHLIKSNIFETEYIDGSLNLSTTEKDFMAIYAQIENLNAIRDSLSKETYEAVISDILHKSDYSVKKNKAKE